MADALSWNERLDSSPTEIRPVREGRFKGLTASDLMLYPNGRDVDTVVRTIPAGHTRTLKELRAELSAAHGAAITCPVTTAKSLLVAAEAAREAYDGGAALADIAPVWRILDETSSILRRVSFDPSFLLAQRAREASATADES